MTFLADNGFFASGLNILRDKATALYVCSGAPATVANVISYQLAREVMTSADYTMADGDTSGRKCTVAQQATITIDTSGGADHIALMNGVTLFYVTEAVTQQLTAAGTVTVPAWDIEIRDPAAE